MYDCRARVERDGGSSVHSSSTNRFSETTRPAFSANNANTARCLGPPKASSTPSAEAETGPRRVTLTCQDSHLAGSHVTVARHAFPPAHRPAADPPQHPTLAMGLNGGTLSGQLTASGRKRGASPMAHGYTSGTQDRSGISAGGGRRHSPENRCVHPAQHGGRVRPERRTRCRATTSP